ncbi:MAG: CpXC domain-containing protein [Planctomycetota bacterium]
MSTPEVQTLECSVCLTAYEATYWSSVNGTLRPDLRADLMHNRLNWTTCPGCGCQGLVSSVLYHDQARKFMVWVREPDADGVIRLEPEAVRFVGILPNYVLRIVPTRDALIEKMHTFELSLDDRIIEMLKYGLWTQFGGNPDVPRDRFWFAGEAGHNDDLGSATDLVFLDTDSRDENRAYLTHSDHYAPLEAEFGDLLRRTGGRDSGWCRVDQAFVHRVIGGHQGGGRQPQDRPPVPYGHPAIRQEMLARIGSVLHNYIAIHDDVFKVSVRRVVPIPGLFKRVDFGAHARSLTACSHRLSEIGADIRASGGRMPKAPLDTLQQYCAALYDAAARLGDICERLHLKALGQRAYSPTAYKADVSDYHAAVNRYRQLGRMLNELS